MIAVIGDIMVDVIVEVDKYPREGGEAICKNTSIKLGGSACNTAVLLTKLHPETYLFSQIGNDYYGQIAMLKIENSGLNPEHIVRKEMKMGYMMIVLSEEGQRTMFSSRIAEPIPVEREYYADNLPGFELVHISGYLLQEDNQWDIVKNIVEISKKHGIMISLDPGTSTIKYFKSRVIDLLRDTDIFLPNEYELSLLTGDKDFENAMDSMNSLSKAKTIVKCGAAGCKFRAGHRTNIVTPNCAKPIINTVGAGDAFNAGFLDSYTRGTDMAECCKNGNEIAVKLITQNSEIMNIEI